MYGSRPFNLSFIHWLNDFNVFSRVYAVNYKKNLIDCREKPVKLRPHQSPL